MMYGALIDLFSNIMFLVSLIILGFDIVWQFWVAARVGPRNAKKLVIDEFTNPATAKRIKKSLNLPDGNLRKTLLRDFNQVKQIIAKAKLGDLRVIVDNLDNLNSRLDRITENVDQICKKYESVDISIQKLMTNDLPHIQMEISSLKDKLINLDEEKIANMVGKSIAGKLAKERQNELQEEETVWREMQDEGMEQEVQAQIFKACVDRGMSERTAAIIAGKGPTGARVALKKMQHIAMDRGYEF